MTTKNNNFAIKNDDSATKNHDSTTKNDNSTTKNDEGTYQIPRLFPHGNEENLLICIPGVGVSKDFSVLITDKITDLQFQQNGQCFPLYYYEKK